MTLMLLNYILFRSEGCDLGKDITDDDFDLSIISSSSVIRVHTQEDLSELWAKLRVLGRKLFRGQRKRKSGEALVDDDKPKKKRKNSVDTKNMVHASYTPMHVS